MNECIVSKILSYSAIQPQKPALKCKDITVSYKQLSYEIQRYSSYLKEKGVSKGDVILLAGENKLEFIYSYFAVHLLGGVNVVVDVHSNPERLYFIQGATRPKISIGGFKEDAISYEELQNCKQNVTSSASPNVLETEDICDILFTTGTTAAPKGVCLSHRNESAAARNINEFIGNTSNDIELIALPLCHSFGLGRLRCTLYSGATAIIINGFTNVNKFFTTIEEEHVTGFGMVPAAWNYLKRASKERIGNFRNQLKYIEIGSAPMPIEDKRYLCSLLPRTRICMHYGLTEASRSTFLEFHNDKNNLDSVGKQTPNVEIKVKDSSGNDCNYGVEGEICVKGYHVMERYLADSDNSHAWFGEFFRTGDWGYKKTDGYIYLIGRGKELINVGGKKLSPEEVENEIMQCGLFADCACVGVPDPKGVLGEVVKCFAVQANTENRVTLAELVELLKDKLETFKIPVQLEYIDKIPTTASGKKQRIQLKSK